MPPTPMPSRYLKAAILAHLLTKLVDVSDPEDKLDAQTIEVQTVGDTEVRLRVLPSGQNAPRYFTIKVTENL